MTKLANSCFLYSSTIHTRLLNTNFVMILLMSMTAWKCYRCNLTFKDPSHVDLHRDISQHEARQVEIPE